MNDMLPVALDCQVYVQSNPVKSMWISQLPKREQNVRIPFAHKSFTVPGKCILESDISRSLERTENTELNPMTA